MSSFADPIKPKLTVSDVSDMHRNSGDDAPVRLAWAALGSVWFHLGAALLLMTQCNDPSSSTAPTSQAPVSIVLLSDQTPEQPQRSGRSTSASGSSDDTTAKQLGGAPAGHSPTNASGGSEHDALTELAELSLLAAMTPDQISQLDPALLGALTAEQLAAMQAIDVLAQLSPAQVAALQALVTAQLQRSTASASPLDVALSDANAAAAPQDDLRNSSVTASASSDALTDDDAVADMVLDDVKDKIIDKEHTPDEIPADDELPEPEPTPEPEPDEPDQDQGTEEWQHYVHVDAEVDTSSAPEPGKYISARDSLFDVQSRSQVVAAYEGDPTRPIDGIPTSEGAPALQQADGDPDGETGDLPSAGEPVQAQHADIEGGGKHGTDQGRGAPQRAGRTEGGAAARSGRLAASSLPAIAIGGGAPGHAGFSEAPAGTREAASSSADRWSPSVTRVLVRAPITPPALSMVATPVPTRSHHAAPVPRPGTREDVGGTESEDDLDELAPKDDGADAEEQGQETELEPEELESIADLQADMGWGGLDRSKLKPRRSLPGVASLDGNMPTSPQTVDNDLAIERLVFVTANDTAAGRYRESIDVEILRVWNKMDLSLHQRAMGLQGDTTVVFAVRSSGKVSDKQLVRSSGYASLDQMALDAVPKRLPRFPVDLDSPSLVHRYTFRYRNPLIVRGGGP